VRGNWGSGPRLPEGVRGNWGEMFEALSSRTSENALLQSRILIVFLLDFYAEKRKLIP